MVSGAVCKYAGVLRRVWGVRILKSFLYSALELRVTLLCS